MNEVYVADHAYGGYNLYVVMVNGKPYAELVARHRLTWSQQADIAAGYREAFEAMPHLIKD